MSDTEQLGLVIGRRAIEPQLGKWALIGGFQNFGESIEEAASREFREETSLEPMSQPKLIFSRATTDKILTVCAIDIVMPFSIFHMSEPCSENFELSIGFHNTELAFPIHVEAAKLFFNGEI